MTSEKCYRMYVSVISWSYLVGKDENVKIPRDDEKTYCNSYWCLLPKLLMPLWLMVAMCLKQRWTTQQMWNVKTRRQAQREVD